MAPAAPRDHPAVHGNSGEPAVHSGARPPHPGRLPAVLCAAALRRARGHSVDGMCTRVHTAPVLNLHMRNYRLLHQESLHHSLFTCFMSGATEPVSNARLQLKSIFKVGIQTSRYVVFLFLFLILLVFAWFSVYFYILFIFLWVGLKTVQLSESRRS